MSKPIRMLHVIGQMNIGGAETMIMNLYRQMDKTKVQFDFIVHTNQKGAYDEEILALGGKIHRVPQFKGSNFLSYKKAWINFFEKNIEYKVIHGHIGSSAAIYLSIAKRFGLFTIAHSHNTMTESTLKGKMYSIFSYPTRYIADFFFGCSNAAGVARYGKSVVHSNVFSLLNNAIKTSDFIFSNAIREKKRNELNLDNKLIIGHIGRFNKQKNHVFLIDIFNMIHKKNSDAVLLLVGDGILRKTIEEKVSKLGLKDNVIFTGVRSDIPELLQAFDVFVFPSLYEGLPVSLIEVQASGLPSVIANNITDEVKITDLVKDVSLKDTAEIWADEILKHAEFVNRRNCYQDIAKAGYDVTSTANWLQEFYIKNHRGLIHDSKYK